MGDLNYAHHYKLLINIGGVELPFPDEYVLLVGTES